MKNEESVGTLVFRRTMIICCMLWSAVANSSFFILHSSFLQAQTITFTGDILLDRGVRHRINAIGVDSLFTPEIDSIFAHSDIVVGNLECPATDLHTPAMKQFVFRANPEWLTTLRQHGISHLNLANNHSVDQRRGGLISTAENCRKAGIIPVGMGENMQEAVQPVLLPPSTLHLPPIYLFSTLQLPLENFTYLPDQYSVSQESIDSLCQRIHQLRTAEPSAYIIVCPHWGIEHTTQPTPWQRRHAHALIDAGADIIIGHHTHTLQSIERYKEKPIYYSIGNFIFDQTKPINTRACMVQIRIAPTSVEVETIPVEIRRCVPYVISE